MGGTYTDSVGAVIRFGLAAACLLLLLAPSPCDAAGYNTAKILAGDGAASSQFGRTMAVSGDTMVIGATGANTGAGAAYVFRFDGTSWVEEDTLTAATGVDYDSFGFSVGISGNTIVVGASGVDGGGTNSGAAYVFRYNGTNWVEEQKLTPSVAATSDEFGNSVGVSGDVIVVGTHYGDVVGDFSGAAYVYRYSEGTWEEEDVLTAAVTAAGDQFGEAVAISGDTILVGALRANSSIGAAYVFRHDETGWTEEVTLTPLGGSAQDQFGANVAIEGDTALVAARYGTGRALSSGTAYIFRRSGTNWAQQDKLDASDGAANDLFGYSVALSGDLALIGTIGDGDNGANSGAAYAFWYDGATWSQQAKLNSPDGEENDWLGHGVGLSGLTAWVGAPGDDDDGDTAGAVYQFHLTPLPDVNLTAADGASGDDFGGSVALYGDRTLIGSPGDDDLGNVSGSAYLFRHDGQNWVDEDKLHASDGAGDDRFGTSVALAGSLAAVGAPGHGSTEEDSGPGAAYVFRYASDIWGEGTKLLAGDGAPDDGFGHSVAISGSGNRVVVGAPWNGWSDVGGYTYGSGAAYVFRYDDIDGWVQEQKLLPADGEGEDEFGFSVSIRGDSIVVGAHLEDENGIDAGAAYVYFYDGANWLPDGKLMASDGMADDEFGFSVVNSNDTIVIGAIRHNGTGAAYVFGHDGAGWVEESKLTASDGALNDRFGFSVGISDVSTILVGAEYDDAKGSAYSFSHDGSIWVQDLKFIAPIRGTNYFGTAVAIAGDTVLIGAENDNGGNGAAYVSTATYAVPEPSMLILDMVALATLACIARRRTLHR
jgi:hypothetical protein